MKLDKQTDSRDAALVESEILLANARRNTGDLKRDETEIGRNCRVRMRVPSSARTREIGPCCWSCVVERG